MRCVKCRHHCIVCCARGLSENHMAGGGLCHTHYARLGKGYATSTMSRKLEMGGWRKPMNATPTMQWKDCDYILL